MRTLFFIASNQDFSDAHLSKIENINPENVIIFSLHSNDSSSELQEKFDEMKIPNAVHSLTPLSTTGVEDVYQLRSLAWDVAKEMLNSIGEAESPIVMLGRGSSLHDHLLWLTGNSFNSEQYHWDGEGLEEYRHNDVHLNSEIASKVLGTILELGGKNYYNGSNDFSAEDIAAFGNVTEMSGVQAATKPSIDRNYVKINRSDLRPPTYELTTKGFPVALNYWKQDRKYAENPIFKRLLISFARFGDKREEELMKIMSTIKPHDSYLFIFQRYLNESDYSGILTLEEAIEFDKLSSIHEELENCRKLLNWKKEVEGFEIVHPLVVINPKSDADFALHFYRKLFNTIRNYEYSMEQHLWTFDITSCMASIRNYVSTFSVASESKINYVLKSTKGKGSTGMDISSSPFSRADHVLNVPSSLAIESLSSLPTSRLNVLVILMYFQQGLFNKNEPDNELDELLSIPEEIVVNDGLSWADIVKFGDELRLIHGDKIKIPKNQTHVLEALYSNQFISRVNDTKANRYVLTELGDFVANWLVKNLGLE